MNYIKNLSLACIYLAEQVENNNSLKDEFQKVASRFLIILKNYSNSIKDILDKEISYTLNLVELGEVSQSISSSDAEIFKQGVAKIRLKLNERSVSKISLSHYFNKIQEELQLAPIKDEVKVGTILPSIQESSNAEKVDESESEDLTSRERKQIILAALSRQASGLREIRELIPNTNDKTIQRDLNDLIRDRKVLRMGSKRWAKYYIK